MLSVLKAQVTNLDSSKYKVMLVWDPDNARDIGWLTVEKDMKVDLAALQVRDVNLNKINLSSKPEPEPEPSNPNNESEGNIVNSSSFGEDNEEVIVIEDDVIEDSVLHKAEYKKMNVVNDVDPSIKGKVQCPECKIIVSKKYFPLHMARIHRKKFVKSEQVKCEICSVRVNKVNLEFHMKLKHSILTKCEDCGKTLKSNRGLSSHKRFCKKARNKGSKTDGSTAENMAKHNTSEKVDDIVTTNTDSVVIKPAENERIDFSIFHEGRCYSCSRSKGVQIKGSLKKFCKHVGKDLKFEFEGRYLTGAEVVDTFSGGKILASSAIDVNI